MMSRPGAARLGTAALFTFAILAGAGDEEPALQKVYALQARIVRVVDEKGRKRIELTTQVNSHPELWLYDGSGAQRLRIATTPGGAPLIGLHDKAGKLRASLSMAADGSPHLEFFDASAMPRMDLALEEGTGARLALSDQLGAVTCTVPADAR